MTENGDLKVSDLPRREQIKALLPATGSLLGILALVLVVAFAYAAHRADDAQRAAAKQNARLFAVSTSRFQYATNRSVCGFRKLADDGIKASQDTIHRSRKALTDPTTTAGSKQRNLKALQDAVQAIAQAKAFKETQVTVPFDYDCDTLPAKPPAETLPNT